MTLDISIGNRSASYISLNVATFSQVVIPLACRDKLWLFIYVICILFFYQLDLKDVFTVTGVFSSISLSLHSSVLKEKPVWVFEPYLGVFLMLEVVGQFSVQRCFNS